MLPEEIENRNYAIAALGLGVIAIFVAMLTGSAIAAIAAGAFVLLSAVFWKLAYILVPLFTKRMNVVEVRGNYEIPPSQDVIVKKVGRNYYASVFMVAKIYDSVTEKSAEQRGLFMEFFERAVSQVHGVTKFSVLVSNLDMVRYLDEIKTKRSEAETKKARLLTSGSAKHQAEIARIEREIVMYNRMLERLSYGERPMEVVCYLMSTASALSKDEAIGKVRAQANEVRSVVANALDVEVVPLAGEDMKRCFEWEFMIPASAGELSDQVF